MYALRRTASALALLVTTAVFATPSPLCQPLSLPQSSAEAREPTGSIAGRVTVAGKAAPKVTVMLLTFEQYIVGIPPISKTTTDEDGRFRLTRIPAGRYTVTPFAPLFIAP